jgi:hypothetical protein
MEIWEHKPPVTLWATPGLLRDSVPFTPLLICHCFFIPRLLLSKYVLAVMNEVWLIVGFKIVSVAVESVAAVVCNCQLIQQTNKSGYSSVPTAKLQ